MEHKVEVKEKFVLPEHLKDGENCIWTEFAALNKKYKPVDLGTGFPNYLPPKNLTKALKKVALSEDNHNYQYTSGFVSSIIKLFYFTISNKLIFRGTQGLLKL